MLTNNPPRPEALLSTEYESSSLPVLVWPDPRLSQKCEDVAPEEFNDQLRSFVASMFRTMTEQRGVGLAAPQVGILKNIITIDIPLEEQLPTQGTETPDVRSVNRPFVLINPELVEVSDEMFTWSEGCLSVPGYYEDRARPQQIVVNALNDNGHKHTTVFQGLHAFAIQHEIDHLEGKVFVDGLSRLKQDRIKKKMLKFARRR